MLAKRYGWKANFEPVDNNPYLADYYKDMERWSFNLQIYFLNKRFHDVVEISRSEQTIVQDRTIFEDARIFAPNLHDIGMMSDRDFKNYTDLFDLMISLVKLPDLMIYIKSSIPTLVKHIEKRGRDFEKSIRIDYLQGLNNRYEEWIKDYKGRLIIIDGDTLEFADNPEDFRKGHTISPLVTSSATVRMMSVARNASGSTMRRMALSSSVRSNHWQACVCAMSCARPIT